MQKQLLLDAWQRDAEWLTSQYNNRTLVPEHGEFLSRWPLESARYRHHMQAQGCARLDLAYGDSPTQTLDVFSPNHASQTKVSSTSDQTSASPCLFFIHGGWWRALDKSDHSFVAESFVARGAQVVVPNYSLCPQVSIEAIALEMAHALAMVWMQAPAWGIDRSRIVVAGHSAGGHLAALLTRCDMRLVDAACPQTVIAAAVGISGVFDLEPVRHAPFLQQDLKLSAESVARLSPARMTPAPARPRQPTLDLVVGGLESGEFIRQSKLLQAAWGRRIRSVDVVPGTHHFSVLEHWARSGTPAHELTQRVLHRSG